MATIRVCDWTKERLAKDEEAFKIIISGKNQEHEYEVGHAGLIAILKQLDGEEAPNAPQIQFVEREAPTVQPLTPAVATEAIGLDLDGDGDGFAPGPATMPEPPRAVASTPEDDDATRVEVPSDVTNQRLKTPSAAVADRVLRESTKFEEGSLPALTMGNRAQRDAMKKLRALEEKEEDKLKRRAGSDIDYKPTSR